MATKKTKKVETPIDQRETFVSIQKNFADSEISVEEKLRTLYSLQQADTKIDKIHQLRGELPLEVETLENEIAELEQKIATVNEVIAANTTTIAEQKVCIAETDALLEKYQQQIDNISNSREYDSLSKEIENQGLERMIAEKRIAEAKESILDRKQALETLKDKLNVKNEDLAAKKAELATIIESTAKEEEQLTLERNNLAGKIDARTMSAYERIRESNYNHLAVVPVYNGDSCGGCMSTIPPQRRIDIASNSKLIICEYCGRIIVNADFQ